MSCIIEHTQSQLIFKKHTINTASFAISINKKTKEWSFYVEYFENDFVRKHPIKIFYQCSTDGSFSSTQSFFLSSAIMTNLFQTLLSELKKISKYNVWLLTQTHVPKGVYTIWNQQCMTK